MYNKKIIEITKEYAMKISEKMFFNTLLHEIAHALVGYKHGHDKVWKNKALEIGCDGNICHGINFTEYKYKVQCRCDGAIYNYHRRTKFIENVEKKRVNCKKCKSFFNIIN